MYVLRDVVWYFQLYSNCNKTLCKQTVENQDQTPRSAASDLVMQCLPMSHKKDARLKWAICYMYCKHISGKIVIWPSI